MGITDSTLKKIRATVQAAQEKTAGKEQEVSDVCTAAEKLVAHTVAHRVLCEKTKNPASLATRLLGVPLRLGSLEPRTITPEFCRRTAALTNLCPHFHLSLQSGCDGTLERMNRKYDTSRYYESVKLLREYFDRPGVC